jgi:hypothetical protein
MSVRTIVLLNVALDLVLVLGLVYVMALARRLQPHRQGALHPAASETDRWPAADVRPAPAPMPAVPVLWRGGVALRDRSLTDNSQAPSGLWLTPRDETGAA